MEPGGGAQAAVALSMHVARPTSVSGLLQWKAKVAGLTVRHSDAWWRRSLPPSGARFRRASRSPQPEAAWPGGNWPPACPPSVALEPAAVPPGPAPPLPPPPPPLMHTHALANTRYTYNTTHTRTHTTHTMRQLTTYKIIHLFNTTKQIHTLNHTQRAQ